MPSYLKIHPPKATFTNFRMQPGNVLFFLAVRQYALLNAAGHSIGGLNESMIHNCFVPE